MSRPLSEKIKRTQRKIIALLSGGIADINTVTVKQQTENKNMKNVFALFLALAAISAQADIVRGYVRSNGTQVQTYARTPANDTVLDNRSYRGYPSQQPGYVAPATIGDNYRRPVAMPSPDLAPTPSPYAPSALTPSLDIFPKW